jgi:YD repeat-containing protein
MVAIVTGNGLGLLRTSASVLGSAGTLGSAALGRANDGVTLNAANGNLVITNRDEFIIGRGVDVGINRTYNSRGLMTDDNGDNWRLSLQRKIINSPPLNQINAVGTQFTLVDWDGSEKTFKYIAGKGYTSTDGGGAYLHADISDASGRYWIITNAENTQQEWFDNQNGGRLALASDIDRSAWTSYEYDALGRLSVLNLGDGTTTAFVWAPNNSNNIIEIKTTTLDTQTGATKTLTRTRYSYDGYSRLATVTVDLSPEDNAITDGRVYTTTYSYVGASKLVASIAQTDGSLLSFTYDGSNRVTSFTQTVENGVTRTTTISYGGGYTRITDPQGNETDMNYDAAGQLTFLREPEAAAGGNTKITQFFYDASGNVERIDITNGWDGPLISRDWHRYDGNGNVYETYIMHPGVGYDVTRYTYGSKNELLTTTTYTGIDPDGFGGVEPTGGMTTRYVYNATNHLRFMVSPEGRITEYRYNTLGQRTAEIVYSGSSISTAGLSESTSWAEAELANWVNLNTNKTLTERTDTSYDFRGNVSMVTSYSKTDAAGNGLLTSDFSRTIYVYDQYGNLLSKEALGGASVVSGTDLATWGTSGAGYTAAGTLDGAPARQLSVQSSSAEPFMYSAFSAVAGETVSFTMSLQAQGDSSSDYVGILGSSSGWGTGPISTARILSGPGVLTHNGGGLWMISGLSTTEVTRVEVLRTFTQTEGGQAQIYVDYPQGRRVGRSVLVSNTVIAKTPSTETYAYDGMGRTIRFTDAKGVGTWTTFMDAQSRTVVTLANGLTQTSSYNRAGELVAFAEAGGGVVSENLAPSLLNWSNHQLSSAPSGSVDGSAARLYTLEAPVSGDYQKLVSPEFQAQAGDTYIASIAFRGTTTGASAYIGILGYTTGWGGANISSARIISGPGTLSQLAGGAWTLSGLSTTEDTRIEITRVFTQAENGDFRIYPTAGSHAAGNTLIISGPSLLKARYDTSATGGSFSASGFSLDQAALDRVIATPSGTLNGSSAVQYTLDTRRVGDSQNFVLSYFSANAGDTFTQSVSFKATASSSSASFGLLGYADGWGNGNDYTGIGRIISGPGILKRTAGGYWYLTGLSTTEATRIEITRVFGQAQSGDFRIYPDYPQGARVGSALIVAGPSITRTPGDLISYKYDSLGRLRIKTDPVGTKSFYFYDKAGRKIADVAGDGGVTEYKYDAADRVVATVQYATALTAAQLASLFDPYSINPTAVEFSSLRPGATASDRWNWNVYDKAGRLIETIDAAGGTTEYRYDGAGRLNITWQRYYQLTAAQLDSIKSTLPTGLILPPDYAGQDRVSRNFYDNDGLLVGTIDPEGYLTQMIYDKAGRKVETVQYYNLPSLTNWLLDSFATLLTSAGTHTSDIHTYTLYDGRGLVGATIDGEGNVTRYHYTARSQISQEVRGQQVAANTVYTLASLPVATGTLETTSYTYDVRGQVVSQVRILSGGTETTLYTYNSNGKLLSQTTSETVSSETRIQSYRYDAKGRLTSSLGGIGSWALSTYGPNPTQAQIDTQYVIWGTHYKYDAADRLIAKITPDGSGGAGNKTLYYYDGDGQLRYEINALGEVMEYRYNVFEDKTDSVVYGTRIAAGTLDTLKGGLVTATVTNAITAISNEAVDSRTQWAYENRGIVSAEYSPLYAVNPTSQNITAYLIDSFGRQYEAHNYPEIGQYDRRTVGWYRRGLKHWDYQALNGSSDPNNNNITSYDYDAFGRVANRYDNKTDGRGESYNYDRAGRLINVWEHIGNNGTYRQTLYDPRSNLISSRDRNGKITTYAYDLFNRNVTTTTAEGVVSTVKKNAYGQTITLTDGAGRTTSYTYDKNGNLKTVTDAAGTTTNNYDTADRLIETVDAKGVKTRFTYDAVGRVLTQVADYGGLNLTTTTVYDAKGQQFRVTDALGVVTEFTYDLKGQRTRIAQDINGLNIKTDYIYRGDGKVIWQTDAFGTAVERKTFFEYDSMGRLTRKTEDQGKLNVVTNYVWDENNNLVATSDTLGRITRLVYDLENRMIFSVNAEGEVTENGYDAEGRVIWTRAYANRIAAGTLAGFASKITAAQVTGNAGASASDRINRTIYDGDGRMAYAVDGEGYVTRNVYDGANNVIKVIRYANAITTSNSTKKLDMDTMFGSASNPPADAAVIANYYDGANRLTDVIGAYGSAEASTTRFIMDALGQVLETHIAYGTGDLSITKATFDNVGRVTSETHGYGQPEAATTTYGYDALGRVINTTDPRGFVTTRTYDKLGRMLTEEVPLDASTYATTSYQYDARGNRVKVTDPRGNVGYFFYDGTDRLVQQVDPEGYVTETSYASGSNISSVKRYYNRANNTVSVAVRATVTAHVPLDATTGFTYDKADRVKSSTDAEGFVESYAYDAFGNRIQVQNKLGGVTTYAYNKNGRLSQETKSQSIYGSTETGVVTSYAYDARGNLLTKVEAANIAGNSLTTTYTYDKFDRPISRTDPVILGQTPVTRYEYDKRGNVILMTAPDGGKTYSYFDDNNRKVAEISPVNAHTVFVYDANGNVTSQKVYTGTSAHPATAGGVPPVPTGTVRETQFIYDRNNRLIETRILNVRTGSFNGSSYATTAGATLTSINTYDAAGDIVREQDANGNSIFHYYNKNGHEIAKIDQENYLTIYYRDSEGNVTRELRVINQIPVAVSITNDPVALFNTYNGGVADRITDFAYDRMGRRIREYRLLVDYASVGASGGLSTDQATATIQHDYNGLGEVTRKIEANGDVTNYQYDNQGRLERQLDAVAADYNAGGIATTRHVTYYYYDGNNNIVRTVERAEAGTAVANNGATPAALGTTATGYSEANDRITRYGYDGGKLRWMIDPTLHQTTYWYDVNRRATHEYYTRYNSSGSATATFEFKETRYDLAGRVIEQYISADVAQGRIDQGPRNTTTYNAYGEVATKSIGGVVQERFEYDNAGRVTKTNSGDGVWKFFGYDANGNATLTLTSTANADLAHWDGNWAVQTVTGGNAAIGIEAFDQYYVTATVTTYNKRGLLASTREPSRNLASGVAQTFTRSQTYNAFGEVTSETDARGKTTEYRYNNMGRQIRKIGPTVEMRRENGATLWIRPTEDYYYDISGRLVATRDAAFNETAPNYANTGTSSNGAIKDAHSGNLTTRLLQAGTGHAANSDEALVVKEFRPDSSIWETQYDAFRDARITIDGNNAAKKAAGQAYVFTSQNFDKMGRVIQIIRPATAAGQLIENYSYDGLGQRLKAWNNGSLATNTYQESRTDYDAQGRVISQVGPGGDTTTMSYVWNGSLATTGLGTFGGWEETTTYANYKTSVIRSDVFGREVAKKDMGNHYWSYHYDKAGRSVLGGIVTSLADTAIHATNRTATTYFNTGLVQSITGLTGTESYTYDANGNRTKEYGTNGSGVYKNATASYDALNRITNWAEVGNASLPAASTITSYDAVGNIRRTQASYTTINATGDAAAASTKDYWYTYDAMNRVVIDKGILAGTSSPSGGSVTAIHGGEAQKFAYDANGQRAYKETFGLVKVTTQKLAGQGSQNGQPGGLTWLNEYHNIQQRRRENYTFSQTGQVTNVTKQITGYTITQPNSYVSATVIPNDILGAEATVSTLNYDLLSRLTQQTDYPEYTPLANVAAPNAVYSRTITYNAKNQITSEDSTTLRSGSSSTIDSLRTVVRNDYDADRNLATGSGSTYALGAIVWQHSQGWKNGDDGNSPDTMLRFNYEYWDGAVQSSVNYDQKIGASGAFGTSGLSTMDNDYTTTYVLNGIGQTTEARVRDGVPKNLKYTLDANGQIINRREERVNVIRLIFKQTEESTFASEAAPRELFYRYSGKQMGIVGNNGTNEVNYQTSIAARSAVSPDITSSNAGLFRDGTKTGTVGYADFAQSIDPYNSNEQGSSGGGTYTVQQGDTLQAIAAALYGDSNLWYRIAEANGLSAGSSLTEGQSLTLPAGVTKNTHNAGTFQPYNAAEAMGDTLPTTPKPPKKQQCAVVGQILMVVIAVAVSALIPGSGVLVQMGASMLGSAVSQGVGIALGIQDKFSFKQVAMAGLAAGVSGGLSELSNISKSATGIKKIALKLGEFLNKGKFVNDVVRGAVGSAITQGIGKLTGLQDKFSWASVAAAGIGAGVSAGVSRELAREGGQWGIKAAAGSFGNKVASTMANTIAQAIVRSAMERGSFGDHLMSSLPSALGNLAGGVLGDAAKSVFKGGKLDYADDILSDPTAVQSTVGNDVANELTMPPEGIFNFKLNTKDFVYTPKIKGMAEFRAEQEAKAALMASETEQTHSDAGAEEIIVTARPPKVVQEWNTGTHADKNGYGFIKTRDGLGHNIYFGPGIKYAALHVQEYANGRGKHTWTTDKGKSFSYRSGHYHKAIGLEIIHGMPTQPLEYAPVTVILNANDPDAISGDEPKSSLWAWQDSAKADLQIFNFSFNTMVKDFTDRQEKTGGFGSYVITSAAGFGSGIVNTVIGAAEAAITPLDSTARTIDAALLNQKPVIRSVREFSRDFSNKSLHQQVFSGSQITGGAVASVALASGTSSVGTRVSAFGKGTLERFKTWRADRVDAGESGSLEVAYKARYTSAYEQGLIDVDSRIVSGSLKNMTSQPDHLFRANQIDAFARRDLRRFAAEQGHGSDLVRINQRLYLEGASGKYRVPDLYFPQSKTIFDGTLGTKSLNTPQIIDFRTATGNAPVGIVNPNAPNGFYWLGK